MTSVRFQRRRRAGASRSVGVAISFVLLGLSASSTVVTADLPASSSTRDSVKVYEMHRPGLRVRLHVHPGFILPARVWVLRKCSNGFEGSSALTLEDPTQKIPIDRKGRFKFVFSQSEYPSELRLAGHVYERKITGTYSPRRRTFRGRNGHSSRWPHHFPGRIL